MNRRTWRVDLAIDAVDVLIDLDPARWHNAPERDQRKANALRGRRYVRVRPRSLPRLQGVSTVLVPDDDFEAATWASALRPYLERSGLKWVYPDTDDIALALARAAVRWQETTRGRPKYTAADAVPALREEYIENLTRPGIDLDWLSPSAKDQARWRCSSCGHEWQSSIASRASQRSRCPECALLSQAKTRSTPPAGESLAATRPDIAAEFVRCLPRPDRQPESLWPRSNFVCVWRCSTCGRFFDAQPAARVRGRGCPTCGKQKAARKRSTVDLDLSLHTTHPDLAGEFVALVTDPDRTVFDIPAGSNKRARWHCKSCGFEWAAVVASRAAGCGCPRCGQNRTAQARATPAPNASLQDLHQEIAAEFVGNLSHPDRSTPSLKPNSHDRCIWRCRRCGHEWQAIVKNRVRSGTGCPACARGRIG